MDVVLRQLKKSIEQKLDMGYRKFVIFPFGEVGVQARNILRDIYGIEPAYILHSRLWKYNPAVKPPEFLDTISRDGLCALLSTANPDIHSDCKAILQKYFADEAIAELPVFPEKGHTKIGKYSVGPLCVNHPIIASIGAFSSFAAGSAVVGNHSTEYLTTHGLISGGADLPEFIEYSRYKGDDGYFEGVQPRRDKIKPFKRITIGNDVWLGRNVIITNYSNIGNGVIAGAGAVITKDVPDYAVVVGVPARIIRFRYSPEEIESLNKIAWWDWTDDEIRERYDDFYLPVGEFIRKYLK